MSGLQRVADAEVPTEANETHVHNACRAREDVTGDVHIAPDHSERPVPCVKKASGWRSGGKENLVLELSGSRVPGVQGQSFLYNHVTVNIMAGIGSHSGGGVNGAVRPHIVIRVCIDGYEIIASREILYEEARIYVSSVYHLPMYHIGFPN
jgi:hypothetical protein